MPACSRRGERRGRVQHAARAEPDTLWTCPGHVPDMSSESSRPQEPSQTPRFGSDPDASRERTAGLSPAEAASCRGERAYGAWRRCPGHVRDMSEPRAEGSGRTAPTRRLRAAGESLAVGGGVGIRVRVGVGVGVGVGMGLGLEVSLAAAERSARGAGRRSPKRLCEAPASQEGESRALFGATRVRVSCDPCGVSSMRCRNGESRNALAARGRGGRW